MKTLLVLLLAVVLIPSANAQYKSLELNDTSKTVLQKPKLSLKPEAKFDDMLGQFVGGNLAGGLVGLGGAYLGSAIDRGLGKSHGEYAGFAGAILGFVAGHCAGSIIGVYGIGSSKDVTGDVGSTILGGVLGTSAGIGTLFVARNEVVGWSTLAFPTAGAMIGFNSTLRYKTLENNNKSELKDLGTHLKIKNDFEIEIVRVNFTLPKESEISKIPERFLLSLK
jgi:hypothetical protein